MAKKKIENKNTENNQIEVNFSDLVENFNRRDIGTPKVSESFGRDPWIRFGEKNDFPQELLRLYQNADGLHAAIIKRKVDMVASLGWNDNLPLADFIKNEYGADDLNELVFKTAFDLVLFGGFYLNIVWDNQGKMPAKIYHVPYEKVRAEKPTREDGEISNWYISRDWQRHTRMENKPYLVPNFDYDDEQKRIEEPSQLYFCKTFSPGMDVYSLPGYFPIVNWLKLSYEVSTYHVRSAQNSYMPNLIVSIPHSPPPEQRERDSAEIKMRSGTDNAGQTVVVYGNGQANMPQFTVLQPSTNDQKFKDILETLNQEIYIGHAANNVIAGVAVAGKLADSSQIIEQFEMFQSTVIRPMQIKLENTFNRIASWSGLQGDLQLKNYKDYIKTNVIPAVQEEKPEQT